MPLTAEDRELKFRRFIQMKWSGRKSSVIISELGINKNTLSHWNQIDDNNELFLTVKNPGGGHKKITPEDDQALRAMALDNNWHSITQLRQTEEFQENERLMSVSDETLRQRLRSTGVRRRVAAIKTRLREWHKESRLRYANAMIDWTFVNWAHVIFIDEFHVSSAKAGRLWVWRENNTRYEERNIATVNTTQRFTVSFVLFFSFHGLGVLHILERTNKESYSEFLEEKVLPYIDQHYDDGHVYLLHDNHPVHNSNHVREWISNNIGAAEDFVIPHPGLSPDLNPTENVSSVLKGLVRSTRPVINSREDLVHALTTAFQQMQGPGWRQFFIDLVQSMPTRLAEVAGAQGGHTRY